MQLSSPNLIPSIERRSPDPLPSISLDTVRIGALEVVDCSPKRALAYLIQQIETQVMTQVVFVNAHVVTTMYDRPNLRQILLHSVQFNDGVGIAVAARLHGQRIRDNLNGTDFCPQLLDEASRRQWPVFFYGARPEVLKRALTEARRRYPDIQVAGRSGYGTDDPQEAAELARDFGARIILVGLGVPIQEEWLSQHLADTGCSVGLGVGAFFDFLGGSVRRAPRGWRSLRLEWLWRLLREPHRLWKRYLIGGPRFLWWAWSCREG